MIKSEGNLIFRIMSLLMINLHKRRSSILIILMIILKNQIKIYSNILKQKFRIEIEEIMIILLSHLDKTNMNLNNKIICLTTKKISIIGLLDNRDKHDLNMIQKILEKLIKLMIVKLTNNNQEEIPEFKIHMIQEVMKIIMTQEMTNTKNTLKRTTLCLREEIIKSHMIIDLMVKTIDILYRMNYL